MKGIVVKNGCDKFFIPCEKLKECETLTTLVYDPEANTLTYTDELEEEHTIELTGGESVLFQTNSTDNTVQTLLNLIEGDNITLSEEDGVVTISATDSSVEFQTNSEPNEFQPLLNLIDSDTIEFENTEGGDVTAHFIGELSRFGHPNEDVLEETSPRSFLMNGSDNYFFKRYVQTAGDLSNRLDITETHNDFKATTTSYLGQHMVEVWNGDTASAELVVISVDSGSSKISAYSPDTGAPVVSIGSPRGIYLTNGENRFPQLQTYPRQQEDFYYNDDVLIYDGEGAITRVKKNFFSKSLIGQVAIYNYNNNYQFNPFQHYQHTIAFNGAANGDVYFELVGAAPPVGLTLTFIDHGGKAATYNITIDVGAGNTIRTTSGVSQTFVMDTNGQSITIRLITNNTWHRIS